MKSVLLINRGEDTDNIGDVAINHCLSVLFKDFDLKVSTANFTGFYTKVNFISFVFNAVQKIRKSDLVVIGGGQLFQSNRKFPISFFIWAFLSFIFRKKLVVFAAGFDEKFINRDVKLFKFGLFFVSEIYVRDDVSEKSCLANFNRTAKRIVDPVFLIGQLTPRKRFKEKNTALVGVVTYSSISRYNYMGIDYNDYLDLYAKYVLDSLDKNLDVFLIYNSRSDYAEALNLKEYLLKKYILNIDVLKYETLEDYLDIVCKAKIVVSGRLHALIIAKSLGVPNITPIVRNQKLDAGQHIVTDFDELIYASSVRAAIQDVVKSVN